MADIFGIGSIVGAGIGAGANIFGTILGNEYAAQRESEARQENYQYNERAAENADARTRALYNDIYSPQAQLQQLKTAGLSPSLFYGDGGGISGQAGAQGAGAGGISPNVFGAPIFDFAQLAKTIAETKLINAQEENISKDTDIKKLQEEMANMQNGLFKSEFALLNTGYQMPDGSIQSYYDIAGQHHSFDSFINAAREAATAAGDQSIITALASEAGMRTMRDIYTARHQLSHDIAILTKEQVSAEFQKKVINAMNSTEFANLNAKSACKYLETQISAAELTKTQKDAWNNLLNKIGEKNETLRDVVVVIGMIFNQAMSNYNIPWNNM